MRTYFTRLLQYDHHTNLQITDLILKAGNPEKPVQLMAHMLAAQQIWLSRCKGEPAIGGALWPDWPAETLNGIIENNYEGWTNFLNSPGADDFNRMVSYKNLKGENFENTLSDIMAHLINHGTHHRAQAGQHLLLAGAEKLPVTDYIFYIRELH